MQNVTLCTLLLYVTVCEKVVPRLNKHDDIIESNFMEVASSEMKSWLRPCKVYILKTLFTVLLHSVQ